MGRHWTHIVPVWLFTAVAVIWVGIRVSDGARLESLVAVLATSVLVSFVLQIVAYRSGGLVKRLTLAVAGSTVLTLGASLVFTLVAVVE
jgi:hypothetical protein